MPKTTRGRAAEDPATPDAERPTDARAAILDAATRLFAAHGFDGTSLQAIASEGGIRKPSLLYHFPSKAALREAVLEALLTRWNALLPELLLAAAKARRFDAVMEALTSFFLEDPDRARLLLREALDRPDALRALLAEYVRPWVAVVRDQLEAARADGFVHADADVEAYAVQIIHLVVGGVAVMDTMTAVLGPGEVPPERRLTRELLRFARAGLFARPLPGAGDRKAPADGARAEAPED